MMKFLMFDFDGVIVNSFSLAYGVMKQLGAAPATEDQYREYFNGSILRTVGSSIAGGGDRVTQPTPFFQLYGPELLKKRPVPGMAELLRELKEAGHPMVIVSSTMDAILEAFLTEYGIRDCFTAIYGATYHKDKAYKIERALEDVQMEAKNALFITDTLGDIHDATENHVPAIAVTWGYQPVETLQKGSPIGIAHTVEELRALIR